MTQLMGTRVRLKVANDAEVAAHLRALLKDADDGFRRVIKAGLYIEWIAANLPHGQLMPWLSEHCPDVRKSTIYNWRNLAKNLCEWSGLKFATVANLPVPGDQLLEVPVEQLSPALRQCRQRMEEALSESKSPKQLFLFLGFKQGEIDTNGYPRSRKGRLKGSDGNPKHKRVAAQERLQAEQLLALGERVERFVSECEELADDLHLGEPELDRDLFLRTVTAVEFLHAYLRRLNSHRR